ncbi:MAG: translation initiation factor IF-2 subunit beta [Candidatus Woesearchaeota archaeon]
MDYNLLLKRAINNLPEIVSVRERFEIPKVKGHLQGNKTIISNFNLVCNILHREPQHLLKYLLKELATSGDLKNSSLVFNRKLSSQNINQKIRQYANIYVLCSECGKPETKIINENQVNYIKCQACGAKHHLKA